MRQPSRKRPLRSRRRIGCLDIHQPHRRPIAVDDGDRIQGPQNSTRAEHRSPSRYPFFSSHERFRWRARNASMLARGDFRFVEIVSLCGRSHASMLGWSCAKSMGCYKVFFTHGSEDSYVVKRWLKPELEKSDHEQGFHIVFT